MKISRSELCITIQIFIMNIMINLYEKQKLTHRSSLLAVVASYLFWADWFNGRVTRNTEHWWWCSVSWNVCHLNELILWKVFKLYFFSMNIFFWLHIIVTLVEKRNQEVFMLAQVYLNNLMAFSISMFGV